MKVPDKLSSWAPCLLFSVLMIALVVLGFRKQVDNPAGSDLVVFLHAGRLMLDGADLYLVPTHGYKFYRYPPLLAFFMGPLTHLPFSVSLLIWSVLSAVILSAVCLVWFRVVTGVEFFRQRPQTQWVIGGITLLVTLRYVLSHFNYGQVNLFILALLVFGCVLVFRGRPISGGMLIGISTVIKPFALPFLVWFAVSRQWRALIGVVAAGLAGLALPAVRTGVDGNLEHLAQWVRHMADTASPTTDWLASNNVSLYSSLQRLLSDHEVSHLDGSMSSVSLLALPGPVIEILAWVLFVLIVFWIARVSWKYGRSEDGRLRTAVASFLFALVPVLTTTTQKHYFVLIIPAAVYVVCAWLVFNFRDAAFRWLVAVSFTMLAATGPAIWSKSWAWTFQASGVVSIAALLLAAAIGRSLSVPGLDDAAKGARNVP